MDPCGESFFFYGLTDFILFLVLAWRYGFLSEIFFVFFYPEYLAFGSVHHEPCPTTNFSYYLFPLTGRSPHFRFGVPANHLASLFFLSVSGDPSEVTKYKHLFLTVILWWVATVNSNKRIVVIIFLSSQWDTTWQYILIQISLNIIDIFFLQIFLLILSYCIILTDNTTILEHQNHKQKLQILEALHIRNMQPTLKINFQTSANVLKCL